MNAYTTYHISINGSDDYIKELGNVLKSKITDVDYKIGNNVDIIETHECVFEDDVVELAKEMARKANGASFLITGHIDTSETAGELQDFEIKLENSKLTAAFSDWYIETAMDCYENYEEFNEDFFECTKEEYDSVKNYEFVNIIETDDGEVLSGEVQLHEAQMIEY